jgi:pyridoxine 4-dehydrogenase
MRMQDEGKIRYVGLSNVTLDQLACAQEIVPIATVQNRYNLADRRSERMTVTQSEEMIDRCEEQGIGFIPWAPLAFGNLAQPGSPLDEIARERNARPAQIALAWLLKRSGSMLPIPGTSKVEYLEQDAAAAALERSRSEFEALDGSGF